MKKIINAVFIFGFILAFVGLIAAVWIGMPGGILAMTGAILNLAGLFAGLIWD